MRLTEHASLRNRPLLYRGLGGNDDDTDNSSSFPTFYGYSSESYPGVTEVYVHKPGWETNPDQLPVKFGKGTWLENTAFGFRMTVKEYKLFDMDLDKVYENAGTADSIGLARARIVGMRLTIRVELREREKIVFNAVWPLGNPDLHLYLSKDESWTRNILGKPGRTVNEITNTDAYGIRMNMLGSTSKYLRYPNPFKIFRALIDLVVFLIIFKSLIRLYSFFALGSTSKKWRRALNMNVETHVYSVVMGNIGYECTARPSKRLIPFWLNWARC